MKSVIRSYCSFSKILYISRGCECCPGVWVKPQIVLGCWLVSWQGCQCDGLAWWTRYWKWEWGLLQGHIMYGLCRQIWILMCEQSWHWQHLLLLLWTWHYTFTIPYLILCPVQYSHEFDQLILYFGGDPQIWYARANNINPTYHCINMLRGLLYLRFCGYVCL